ncbi:hypothetical protein V497_02872 [Pseudogymnoascus sp. VKM F-4516 (FW-969)]|nr:hypothetical protein V497_02872 [Pseudogymnoascus sp. VKM F-4516 (FW-969)]
MSKRTSAGAKAAKDSKIDEVVDKQTTLLSEETGHFSLIRALHLADLITELNGLCGVMSIFSSMRYMSGAPGELGNLWAALAFMPFGLFFDFFDGKVARWRRKSSLMGQELDSLADLISFGVSPAAAAFAIGFRTPADHLILAFFVLCGLTRLARFNVTVANVPKDATGKSAYFEGTPIPTTLSIAGLMAYWVSQGWVHGELPLGTLLTGTPLEFHPVLGLFVIAIKVAPRHFAAPLQDPHTSAPAQQDGRGHPRTPHARPRRNPRVGAVMRVMPDDNSCLFRAFAAAVLPGDDLSMLELRSLVASQIQEEPDVYTKVVLDNRAPDDYCRWIQTEEAWGGAIELAILAKHFNVEVCSIDVQSLRIDRYNESANIRCILVYSGIHYDTIVQSPSDPPHTIADNPPELDKRVWDSFDDEILIKAQELCRVLQGKHYFTNVSEMAIKCNVCGWVGYGEGQAAVHAQQSGHYDMAEQKA